MFLLRSIVSFYLVTFASFSLAQNLEQISQTNTWSVSIGSGAANSNAGRASESYLNLTRYTELGSVAIERIQLRRFGSIDTALAVDAYPKLWTGAYANIRYQSASSPDLYPKKSWRAEVYQNIPGGWELAASHDHLGFISEVIIDGISVGYYWGNFYARLRHQRVFSNASSGSGDRLMVRYYYEGDADHYVEFNASKGRSDDFSTAQIAGNRSDTKGVAWYHFFNRNWGLKITASQANDSSVYAQKERIMNAGLSYRW